MDELPNVQRCSHIKPNLVNKLTFSFKKRQCCHIFRLMVSRNDACLGILTESYAFLGPRSPCAETSARHSVPAPVQQPTMRLEEERRYVTTVGRDLKLHSQSKRTPHPIIISIIVPIFPEQETGICWVVL